MNKKRTNYLVAVLNIIAIIAFYIFTFSKGYLMSSVMSGENYFRSIYNSFIIDILANYIEIILPVMYSEIGIVNIICAIQNKKNKKIYFWQLVFGAYYLLFILREVISWTDISLDIIYFVDIIIFTVIPIILAIKNIFKIKKNKPKVIEVISYIAVIILSILSFLGIIDTYWQIIAIVMQLIYIHFQDKNIEESKAKNIINIILYYIFQLVFVVGFLGILLVSLITTKINDDKCKSELEKLYNNVTSMQGVTNQEIYIPVEKNYKYGFINEKGQEIIPCEYDRVSYFNEVEINNKIYYIAFGKKNTQFYIISKSNEVLLIENALEEYIQIMYEHWDKAMINTINKGINYRCGYVETFELMFQTFNANKEIKLTQQTVEINNDSKEKILTEQNSKYYYNNQNYSMLIEPVHEEWEEDYYNENEDEDMYYVSTYTTKCKVTVSKSNGEVQSSIVDLPGFNEEDSILKTFTNGYIGFENGDGTKIGWYDNDGNQISIPRNYTIIDIKDDKVILQVNNDYDNENYDVNAKYELKFIIIDMNGKTLLQTTVLDVYDNMYLVKNNNKKMVLLDKDLNVISKEYDRISVNMNTDETANYSYYY